MKERLSGLFAGRGISLPGFKITALVLLGAFAAGVLIGWVTTFVPDLLRAGGEPTATASPSPSASPSPDISVSVPPLEPIFRTLDDDDRLAGLTTLDYVYEGEGTFTVVTGSDEPVEGGPPVRWVNVAVEDGVEADARAFAKFVMAALNDYRGWGASGRVQFVLTDGVADITVELASPYTAAAECPTPHAARPPATDLPEDDAAAGDETTPTPTPSPSATVDLTCAAQGRIVLSTYDWAAGLPSFDLDRTSSRVYQINHAVGHLMGQDDGICVRGRALVMAEQRELAEECTINPWPFPDATKPEPEPSASPTPGA